MKTIEIIILSLILSQIAFADMVITNYSAPVAKTGEKTSKQNYDDGYYQKGVVSPNPRFVVTEKRRFASYGVSTPVECRNLLDKHSTIFSIANKCLCVDYRIAIRHYKALSNGHCF